jgi:DNA-binding transcriptional regulator YiaG
MIEFLGYNPFHFDDKSIGGQIKMYRVKNGLSHRKLSKITGFDPATLASWEQNMSAPNLNARMKLVIFDVMK